MTLDTFERALPGHLIRLQDDEGGWMHPVRVLTRPGPCGDECCGACTCRGVTVPDGRTVPVHANGSTPVQVLDFLPPATPGSPGPRVDAVSEHSQTGGHPVPNARRRLAERVEPQRAHDEWRRDQNDDDVNDQGDDEQ